MVLPHVSPLHPRTTRVAVLFPVCGRGGAAHPCFCLGLLHPVGEAGHAAPAPGERAASEDGGDDAGDDYFGPCRAVTSAPARDFEAVGLPWWPRRGGLRGGGLALARRRGPGRRGLALARRVAFVATLPCGVCAVLGVVPEPGWPP